jgi:hypothetical protein
MKQVLLLGLVQGPILSDTFCDTFAFTVSIILVSCQTCTMMLPCIPQPTEAAPLLAEEPVAAGPVTEVIKQLTDTVDTAREEVKVCTGGTGVWE